MTDPKCAVTMWAGYCDGRVDVFNPGGVMAQAFNIMGIFKTRAAAKRYYEDVRQVRVTLIRKPK